MTAMAMLAADALQPREQRLDGGQFDRPDLRSVVNASGQPSAMFVIHREADRCPFGLISALPVACEEG
jgi:hypothetical protein